MRWNAYAMSCDVIARLSGGPNLMPDLRWNVYVSPWSVGFGTDVARSATGTEPAAPGMCRKATSVRLVAS